jgi:hypothetical protein
MRSEFRWEGLIIKYRLTVGSKIKGRHFKRSEPKRPELEETFRFTFFRLLYTRFNLLICVFSITKFQHNEVILGDLFSPNKVVAQATK